MQQITLDAGEEREDLITVYKLGNHQEEINNKDLLLVREGEGRMKRTKKY